MSKLANKLTKVSESITITMYDNGFLFDANGRNAEDEWAQTKIVCNNLDEVITLLTEAASMERD
jgi:hypothetical protein